jgi:Fe-S cluster assembly protein SufD
MTLIRIQDDPKDTFYISQANVNQESNSSIKAAIYSLNGKLIRNNLNCRFLGQGCDANINGLFLPKGDEIMDNHIFIDHAKARCTSNELFKGIMKDRSIGVFNGKIMVREDAQQTNAYQTNHNILLSDEATVNTKPQLEIYADDVKCSHGATLGNLDEESIFYLRSRGIGKDRAKAMLLRAFADEIINLISFEELKDLVSAIVDNYFESI